MTTSSEHSWMDDVIDGRDYSELLAGDEDTAGYSEPGTVHDTHPVKLVVNEFLARKDLFSRADLEGYINTALQNEAGEMILDKTHARELAESWSEYAESLRTGQIPEDSAPMTVEEAEAKGAEAVAGFEAGYAESRRLLAETVADLHEANDVPVTAETWGTLADLDEDGYFSECLGFDAQSALVAAIKAEQRSSTPAPEPARMSAAAASGPGRTAAAAVPVDFSREAVSEAGAVRTRPPAVQEQVQKQAQPSAAPAGPAAPEETAPGALRPQRAEPVQVGKILVSPEFTAGWSQSSRDKLTTAMIDYETTKAEAGSDGPELG